MDGYTEIAIFLEDQKFSDGNNPNKLHTPADGISSYILISSQVPPFRVSLFHLSLSKFHLPSFPNFMKGASYHKSAYHDPRGIPA